MKQGMIAPLGTDKPGRMIFAKDNIDDEIVFSKGIQVNIGKGGFKLKGVLYPEYSTLIVGKDGSFTNIKK